MSTRSIRACCSNGFSLVELLIAMTVTLAISAAVMTLAFSTQDVFEADKHRTTVNQNLRSGIDLLGIDVRQAGERLPEDAPAIEIIDGANGAPDRLILRRNMLDAVLPVCNPVIAGGSAVDAVYCSFTNASGHYPPGCAPAPDLNSDGWPDNLEAWRDYRMNNGGVIEVYIHNPAQDYGEFFKYDAEDASTFHIHRLNDGTSWDYSYDAADNPRLYILEQKEFYVEDGVLKARVNGRTGEVLLNLVSHIQDFQATAIMKDDTVLSALGSSADWSDLSAIEVTLEAESGYKDRTINRETTTRFFPRNVMSNWNVFDAGTSYSTGTTGTSTGTTTETPPACLVRDSVCDEDTDCCSVWCHRGKCK
jgi:type II secretory pathway component PulJ